MAKRRKSHKKSHRRHSTRGLGSAISLKGLGKVKSSRGIMSFLLPTAVGVLVPAGVILAARYFSDPTKGDTQKMIYQQAPWLGLGAGVISAIALYLMGGGTAAAAASGVAATGVALTAFAGDQLLVKDPERRVWAQSLNEGPAPAPAPHAAAGFGNYFTMRPNGALGAAVPQLSATGAVVMSPTNGPMGYSAYSGGETVSLGAVNSDAFGTPGFRP
jgi:hypothetical protein